MAKKSEVNTEHPCYTRNLPLWEQTRHCYQGEQAIKAAGERYLPRLGGQRVTSANGTLDDEYTSYLTRAVFYNATRRTVNGLTGAVVQKKATQKLPPALKPLLTSLTNDGKDLQSLTRFMVQQTLGQGRMGLLVDYDGGRPYVVTYRAEDVINWRTDNDKVRGQLTMVVLRERYVDWKDMYQGEERDRFRVLALQDGVYTQTVYTPSNKKDTDFDEKQYTPQKAGGRTFTYIPFTFLNPSSTSETVEESPVLDLTNLNLAHWRNSADREHALHYTALPTAWVAGFDPETTKLRIGSQTAWVSKDPNANAGYLEFTGAGIGAIASAMEAKKAEMGSIGARLLEEQKRQPESGDALRLRYRGEQSTLAEIADSVSEAMRKVLGYVLDFVVPGSVADGVPPASIVFQLQKDFLHTQIAPEVVDRLVLMLQSGLLSYDQFFYNLQRGGVYEDGHTLEEELNKIDESAEVARRFREEGPKQVGTLPASGELEHEEGPER